METSYNESNADFRAMRDKLCEGDEGARFRTFLNINGRLGAHIVNHALQTYTAYRAAWASRGMMEGFALNYLTTALKVAEAHVPLHLDWMPGISAQEREIRTSDFYQAIWEQWGEFVSEFAIGE